VWGAVFTGVATFIFFGSVLLLNAIFSKPVATEPLIYYYRQVVIATVAKEDSKEAEKAAQAVVKRM